MSAAKTTPVLAPGLPRPSAVPTVELLMVDAPVVLVTPGTVDTPVCGAWVTPARPMPDRRCSCGAGRLMMPAARCCYLVQTAATHAKIRTLVDATFDADASLALARRMLRLVMTPHTIMILAAP